MSFEEVRETSDHAGMQRTGVKMDDSVFATKLLHAVRRLGENVRGTWAPVEQNVTSGRARCDTGYSCI